MEKDYLEIILENMNDKFELVLEGHSAIRSEMHSMRKEIDERFEHVEFKIDTLNKKIDNIASDLSAHRADTEAHHGVYLVKESGD
jgi:chaperonin cofactor prefoldin